MDSIWSCAYGVDLDVQNNPDNEYFIAAEKVFKDGTKFKLFNYLSSNIVFYIINFDFNSCFVINKLLYF